MKLRPIIYLAIAFGLYFTSGSVELQGDAAPINPDGVSTERATYHIIALLMLIGAIGFFIAAGVSLFRGIRDRS